METHRSYIEWSLWTLCSFIFFMVGVHSAGLGALLFFLSAVPHILIVIRFSELKGVLSSVAAVLSLVFLTDLSLALLYTLNIALFGWGLGVLSKRGDRGPFFILKGMLLSLCCKALFVWLITAISEVNIFAELQGAIRMQLESDAFRTLLSEKPELRKQEIDLILQEMRKGIPSALIIYSIVEVFSLSKLTSFILSKFQSPSVVDLPPFAEWRFPQSILLALFVALVASYFGKIEDLSLPFLSQLGYNLNQVVFFLLYIQGVALFWYYAETRSISIFVRVVLVVLTLLHPIITQVISLIGLFDVSWNFRARKRGKSA